MQKDREIPTLIFGDSNRSVVENARRVGLGAEWIDGDPMLASPDAIVSPANTVGEMSGGYDLEIRTKLGIGVEKTVMRSLRESPLLLGQARALKTQSKIPWIIVVPTVVGKLAGSGGNTEIGSLQTKTPSRDVIENGAYNLMHEAFRHGILRVGTVLLGGGVGGFNTAEAVQAMNEGYFRAYEEIDEILYGD
ncbi:Appr-1-p processing enzyme family protein [gamma proteobacterium NOR5-3]|nr:Appr-1-p processing enzyme family protein [gamma proteobacterium NOR5-3]